MAHPWWPLHLLVLVAAAFAGYLLWLDHVVRGRFDQVRWDLPARVYARPLEIYAGLRLPAADVAAELDLLGYRRAQPPLRQGEYNLTGTGLRVNTRGFRFWDGEEPPRGVELNFSDDAITSLVDRDSGHSVPLLRLEPLEFARIIPGHHEDRILVKVPEVPPALIDALLAAEDRRFEEHFGVDPVAIGRALLSNVRAGRIRQGASTLTQQLVKNLFLSPRRTLGRKINEALMALLLERRYDKATILQAYLNEVFLGQDGRRAVHGFGLAARLYFDRPLAELPTEQLALLVALVRGPTLYDPRRHPGAALARRNEVLARMARYGYLTEQRAAELRSAPLGIAAPAGDRDRFPAFMQLVRAQLAQDYRQQDLRTAGLRVFTSLDVRLQRAAERKLAAALEGIERTDRAARPPLEAAAVLIDLVSGEVRALIGGRRPGYAGFNRATDARRPIGSLVKPAVYLAALRKPRRYSVATLLDDAPVSWQGPKGGVWRPHNYDGKTYGRVSLETALVKSLNLATVRLGLDIGLEPVIAALRDLGVTRSLAAYPSLLLGAFELTPLELARMYLTIGNGGYRVALHPIREVTARDGRPLRRYGLAIEQTVAAGQIFLMRYLLERNAAVGTAARAGRELTRVTPVGGKTGTTDDLRDSWFAGYAGDLLGVVWVGRDDNRPAGLTGAGGALRVWIDLMRGAARSVAPSPVPESVQWSWLDERNGIFTEPGCAGTRRVPVLAESRAAAPFQPCPHGPAPGAPSRR
ncbi:MAG: penicillin-binding protein 1B [Gammaproteobacteria bacterium]|nr:penicillin-binding protein 1B [Gammaproteobacteria bacterium]